MRIWPLAILNKLPHEQFNGQHREICGCLGEFWGHKHKTVDYLWNHDIEKLKAYHQYYLNLREDRGYNYDKEWRQMKYRGKVAGYDDSIDINKVCEYWTHINTGKDIYPEHNEAYLRECIDNLMEKGAVCRYMEDAIKEAIND